MVKKRLSALTLKSEKALLHKMSLEDLRDMAYLSQHAIMGNITVEQYRLKESEMISKYGFKVK